MTYKTLCSLAFLLAISHIAFSQNTITLTGTIRDFSPITNPDFEYVLGVETGIVEDQIGSDRKPVYNGAGHLTTHDKATFDQWYRNVPGINLSEQYSITLVDEGDGIYSYTDNEFFPIDNQLLGNEGRNHNFHFTFEIHSKFTYQPGQVFSFSGDDDVWVFINDQLVIDLGGVHTTIAGSVNLDDLNLTPGDTYNFDFFFAERHTSESNFHIETSIELKPNPCAKKVSSRL